MIKKVLTVAGSDSCGGAGIQADIKTITVHGMYAMSIVTALTAQNTTGVYGIEETAPEFVGKQLDSVFTDIFPDAVKIGMVANVEIIMMIAERLKYYKAKNIVIDPVMVSTSGKRLMDVNAAKTLMSELFPLGSVITPNIPEAETLCGFEIENKCGMLNAAEKIFKRIGCAVLIKGGHSETDASDLLFDGEKVYWYDAERIDTVNTHGTGCTLSSAIACGLADGQSLRDSVASAKKYITGALKYGLDFGKGTGPLNHMYELKNV